MYAYTDSSDADCPFTRKSTGGFVVMLNGSPISWMSALQKLVTLSTCESEYVQACLAAQEVAYLREVMMLLGYAQSRTLLYVDNVAAIQLTDDPMHRGRAKHIQRRWHFVRQCVRWGLILTVAIGGTDNPADIFTKPLPEPSFNTIRNVLGVLPTQQGTNKIQDVEQSEEPEEEQLIKHASWARMARRSIDAFQSSLLLEEEEEWESIDKPRTTMDRTQDIPDIRPSRISGTRTGVDMDQGTLKSRPTPTSSGEVVIGNVTVAWRSWPSLST